MRKPYRIPKDKAEEILREAISVADYVYVDELDCSKSFSRQDTDKTAEEVLKIGLNDKNTLYHFIYRDAFGGTDAYFDVGLSTMLKEKPDYFLWIKVSIKEGEKLIKKYKLNNL